MTRVLQAFFNRIIQIGDLTVETPTDRFRVGNATGNHICIRLHDQKAMAHLAIDPSLALGELFTEGRLTVEKGSIYDLLAIAWCNLGLAEPPGPAKAWAALRHATRRLGQFNDITRARKNVSHHYNLDHRLYRLFLDADWQYSCAYFEHENRAEARTLYDEKFCRMWEFYLACCESAFRFGNLVVFQIQLAKHLAAVPITRSYIAETEAALELYERPRDNRLSGELPLEVAPTRRTG